MTEVKSLGCNCNLITCMDKLETGRFSSLDLAFCNLTTRGKSRQENEKPLPLISHLCSVPCLCS